MVSQASQSRLLALLLAAVLVPALAGAQAITYGLGRPATKAEIQGRDRSISPQGEGLPPGRGTAQEGAQVFLRRNCTGCHGTTGIEGPGPRLVGAIAMAGVRNTVGRWPFAPKIWDYINRAMPLDRPGFLDVDEVYAVTAYLLYRNEIIGETTVLDAETLSKLEMPNRKGWTAPPEYVPNKPRPYAPTDISGAGSAAAPAKQ